MESIQLWFRGAIVAERRLMERPLDVGRGTSCALVAPSAAMDRQFVVKAEGGTVLAYDLRGDSRRKRGLVLGREVPMAIGEDYSLLRVLARTEPTTARLVREPLASRRFRLRVGGPHSSRTIEVGPGPVTIGRDPSNSVVLTDPSVSARHAIVFPAGAFVRVVDSGSRNGTFLDGERIEAIEIGRRSRLRLGATDLLVEPLDEERGSLVFRSSAMAEVVAQVDRCATLPFPVLLLGETGVGKEALARRVHDGSARSSRPFVAIDLSTIPHDLIGSELFGFEKGAFTGAQRMHRGAFEQADTGTLFLDEVGELPLELQGRLLRVIETLDVRRLGAESTRKVDVRLVAATHRPLPAMVASGAFRRDLYYRLAQLPVAIPPLRARRDDILPIARAILETNVGVFGPRELARDTEALLEARDYPGNVRDLRNLLLSSAARAATSTITPEDVRESDVFGGEVSEDAAGLARFDGNVTAYARALGLPRTTVRDRMRRKLSGG